MQIITLGLCKTLRKFGIARWLSARTVLFLAALLAIVFAQQSFAADSGTIKGTVRAVAIGATAAQSSFVPDAGLTLTNKATPNQPLKTSSNVTGDFIFENLPSGDYTLTVTANGLGKVSKEIKLEPGALLFLEIDLSATVNESVTIREDEGLLSTSDPSTSNIVRSETLKNLPLRSDGFQSAIQLTPGAVRDGFGNDYLKGTRTGQSGYTINGTDATDPVTGKLAFDIPLEAASSVQIEENPYSANFGRFTGGVTNLQTKGGGDKFKVSAARFFPTFHNIFSTKIDSFRPRLTFSGPVISQKVFFLQSFEYRFSRIFVPSQPKPDDNQVQEGVNSFTQIDWNINKSNVLKFNAAFFPNRLHNFGLDTFNPAHATPNYKQRGMLFSVSEQSVFPKASFLSSEISYKTFDVDIFAKSTLGFNVAPETNSGGYFADTRRQTERIQWQETYYSRPLDFHGAHSIKTGLEFYHTRIGGQLNYSSIFIRRLNNTLAQRIDFTTAKPLRYAYGEVGAFAQDRWVVSPTLTLDYGLRFDRDGITNSNNFAPRFSFLSHPFNNARTAIRGGVGIFYDRSLSSAGNSSAEPDDDAIDPTTEFRTVPKRIVTNYASDGTSIIDGPRVFYMRVAKPLLAPRSVRWSLQLDRGITKNLTFRVGFLQRFTKNDLTIDPIIRTASTGTLLLSSNGRSRYVEFQSLLVYSGEKFGQWTSSYVFSGSHGDLNTADRYLTDTPAFVVRPNEYATLPFDTPHRILFYGQLDVSKKYSVRLNPLFEMRSGFPFSKVNERLDFVGSRNGAGRFPMYLSLDLQVTKGVKLPFFHDKRARVGVVFLNATNHFNPRDVQTNLTSPNYGKFYNSLGLALKAKFDIDF